MNWPVNVHNIIGIDFVAYFGIFSTIYENHSIFFTDA